MNKFLLFPAKIQSLKHTVPKGDKKKKKEITLEIAKLEEELTNRHKKELEALENDSTVSVLNFSRLLWSFTPERDAANAVK